MACVHGQGVGGAVCDPTHEGRQPPEGHLGRHRLFWQPRWDVSLVVDGDDFTGVGSRAALAGI